MKKPSKNDTRVQLAVIGAPQGLRGEVRVKTFTGDPLAIGDYGPLSTGDGRTLTVLNVRPAKNVVVARFAEVDDRTAAEALNGTALFVERAALPADLEEDEFYHADLIGLSVIDGEGERVGRVQALHDFGGGDIMEVALAVGGMAMVPFTQAAVPQVRVSEGLVEIDRVAAGLVDDEDADDPDDADGLDDAGGPDNPDMPGDGDAP
ncbi:ribosome maturation factor RimM [Nitratireductor aquibiodomus]|uniref:ribosome maturation factor RimM n=1 Tax=Nitratireductor aquibiodomus TaxID=204799 RepID=UPI0019D3A35D|nr:ribosome maturation factor RimM [Nitratireductor aquibiodomus]MBN7761079.1 ribosome maturation factor RimM [Nitratireductor aquibiodomus]